MKKRTAMVGVILSFLLAIGSSASWIWVMTTYDATPAERLMPMSIPNEAMFGFILSWVTFFFAIHVTFDKKGDEPDKESKEGTKPNDLFQDHDDTGPQP